VVRLPSPGAGEEESATAYERMEGGGRPSSGRIESFASKNRVSGLGEKLTPLRLDSVQSATFVVHMTPDSRINLLVDATLGLDDGGTRWVFSFGV